MHGIPTPHAGPPAPDEPKLLRSIGPAQLIFYGTGSMLGAGIYALIGQAAGMLGNAIWIAFLISMVAAMLTGLSYANLGSRYPRAAGAAYATHRAYRRNWLTYLVGLAVVASGLTSMATGSRAVAIELGKFGFVQQLDGWLQGIGLSARPELLAVGFLLVIAGVVFRGIRESMWLNILSTTIEAAGLLFVLFVGVRYWGNADLLQGPTRADGSVAPLGLSIILSGAVLTFYSFIGFEDVLNVAEECRKPETTIPIGLVGSMLIATAIYLAIAITAVSVVPSAELARGNLRDVVRVAAPWFPTWLFSVITVFAVANTALLNFIMGSRLVYGMSRGGLLPRRLGRVHATRRTPHVAIFALLLIVIALMLSGKIDQLASATVLLLLLVFCIVNGALIVLKLRRNEPRGKFEVPAIVPMLGVLVCSTLLLSRLLARDKEGHINYTAPLIAGVLVVGILVLYAILRPKHVVEDDVKP
jgi:amino acid transporter